MVWFASSVRRAWDATPMPNGEVGSMAGEWKDVRPDTSAYTTVDCAIASPAGSKSGIVLSSAPGNAPGIDVGRCFSQGPPISSQWRLHLRFLHFCTLRIVQVSCAHSFGSLAVAVTVPERVRVRFAMVAIGGEDEATDVAADGGPVYEYRKYFFLSLEGKLARTVGEACGCVHWGFDG